MRKHLFGGLMVALGCALSSAAWAGEREDAAAEFFRAATAAYARGDYSAAARAFEAAHERIPHANTIFNAGVSWQAASEPARAADCYDRALHLGGLSPLESGQARADLAALERSLGILEISGSSDARVSVAHALGRTPPLRVHLLPGDHLVSIEQAHAAPQARRVTVAAGQLAMLRVEEPRPPAQAPVRLDAEAPGGQVNVPVVLAVVALGTAAAAAGTAIGLGVAALDARDAYFESNYTDLGAFDEAAALRTGTNVAWVGAAVLVVTGGVLLVVDRL